MVLLATAIKQFYFIFNMSLVIFLSKKDFITIFSKSFDFSVDSFAFSTKICLFLSFPQMYMQGLKLRKYFRGQVGPHQINFGSPHNLLGAHQVYSAPATSFARCPMAGGPLKAPGSPVINGVKSCILVISWQQNWPFRNYNLIQKITNFQNIFLKINLFYMHQYTMTSEIYC